MAHFAKVLSGKVTQVIVAEPEVIESGVFGDPSNWVQTSYNTRANAHPSNTPLRYNYAVVGGTYDPVADAFYSPQPYPSWILDTTTYGWKAPVPYPETSTEPLVWDEAALAWKVSPNMAK